MIKPTHRHADIHRRTSFLFFDDREPMEFYMRGGICWPITYEDKGQISNNGYALMAGQHLATGDVYIFEQIEWIAIDNIMGDGNELKYPGLSHWFNANWNTYFGAKYFWNQEDELARRFRLQILRSKMIEPKPGFIEISFVDASDIINCVWTRLKAKSLKQEEGTPLDEQIAAVKAGDKQMLPAVHALGCCLLGFERYPWREPYQRPIQEILVP